MRKKLTIKLVLLTIALTGTFMILQSSSPASKAETGKETLESCKKQDKSGGVIWENISHQFFSSF